MSAKYNNPIATEVYKVIAPLLGDIMTQNVLRIQAKKIAKTEETLTLDDLPKLGDMLKTGLTIFIGTEAALSVSQKVKNIKIYRV
jgi:hypothetical protein